MPLGWGPFPFKFYRSWLFYEGFDSLIKNYLCNFSSNASSIAIFSRKLKAVKLAVKTWLPTRSDHHARLLEIETTI